MACSSASTTRNASSNPTSTTKTYRGVSRSGVNSRWRAQLSSRGKTIHLGTFPTADEAARAWDMAVIAERGGEVETNFALSDYLDEFGALRNMALTKGGGGGVGRNEYRGVYNSGSYGRWKARIVVNGRKIHLGTYATAEEAARAWDRRAIKERGPTTVTNFDPAEYANEPEGTEARSLSDGEEEGEEAADDKSSSGSSSNGSSSSSSLSNGKKCRFAPDTRGGAVLADEVRSDDGAQGSSGSDDGANGSSEDSSEGSASPKVFKDEVDCEGEGEGESKHGDEREKSEEGRKRKSIAMDGAVESLLSLCRWGDKASSGGGKKLCSNDKSSNKSSFKA
jgi:hypothetical protein